VIHLGVGRARNAYAPPGVPHRNGSKEPTTTPLVHSGKIWNLSRPLGFVESVKIAGGVAAALLAGFSLTAVVQLVTLGKDAAHPPLAGLAVGAFAVAAALLLQAMVFSSIAVGYAATPGQYLDAYPEAARDEAALANVLGLQREDAALRKRYNSRTAVCYDWGILAFLLGLGFTLIPHRWSLASGRTVALLAVVLALILQVLTMRYNSSWPKALFPSWKDEGPEVDYVASSVAYRALFSDNARAEATLFELRRVADLLERNMKQ
jgi:hypothetical protein